MFLFFSFFIDKLNSCRAPVLAVGFLAVVVVDLVVAEAEEAAVSIVL